MRITSGKFRGRRLIDSSHLKNLRPTTDRNRQALFNILTAGSFLKKYPFNIKNSNVLDLCCGTGAVGIEAISHGAKSLVMIDNNYNHLEIVKKNLELLEISDRCNIVKANIENLPICQWQFDLIFADPPYNIEFEPIIIELIEKNYILTNTLLVIENALKTIDNRKKTNDHQLFQFKNEQLKQLNVNRIDSRIYGNSVFDFYIKKNSNCSK
jgi:16S rRNA (guanine966-N2)-methyltransferase